MLYLPEREPLYRDLTWIMTLYTFDGVLKVEIFMGFVAMVLWACEAAFWHIVSSTPLALAVTGICFAIA